MVCVAGPSLRYAKQFSPVNPLTPPVPVKSTTELPAAKEPPERIRSPATVIVDDLAKNSPFRMSNFELMAS